MFFHALRIRGEDVDKIFLQVQIKNKYRKAAVAPFGSSVLFAQHPCSFLNVLHVKNRRKRQTFLLEKGFLHEPIKLFLNEIQIEVHVIDELGGPKKN